MPLTRIVDGQELPLWTYTTWAELERFIDQLCPDEYTATIRYELHTSGITGLVHSAEPESAANAVAAYRITNPEPE